MSVCFVAGAVVKTLQVSAFTLVWTHSVQKTEWQEDWRVRPDGLLLTAARVKGSGAGIDPPADARLANGWWRWRPQAVRRSEVILSQSSAAGDWRICVAGRCRSLAGIVGPASATNPVAMRSCTAKR
jgi:hypothetical protein